MWIEGIKDFLKLNNLLKPFRNFRQTTTYVRLVYFGFVLIRWITQWSITDSSGRYHYKLQIGFITFTYNFRIETAKRVGTLS